MSLVMPTNDADALVLLWNSIRACQFELNHATKLPPFRSSLGNTRITRICRIALRYTQVLRSLPLPRFFPNSEGGPVVAAFDEIITIFDQVAPSEENIAAGASDAVDDGGGGSNGGGGGGGPAPSFMMPTTNTNTMVGVNLNAPLDYGFPIFKDAWRQSRPWVANSTVQGTPYGGGGALDLDADGWVHSLATNQVADTFIQYSAVSIRAGQYVVLWDDIGTGGSFADGTMILNGGATVNSEGPGRAVVTVPAPSNPDAIIGFRIAKATSSNRVSNIKFVPIEYEDDYLTDPWHPEFINRIQYFRTLRFMDWGATNNSTISSWSDRAKVYDCRWYGEDRGIPVEAMCALANKLGCDAWFSIPHLADDDYITQHATLVASLLDSNLKAYYEWSNETWNGQFTQSTYCQAQGEALGFTSGLEAKLRYTAKRACEMFDLVEAAFGGTSRIQRTIAGQGANPWTGSILLGHEISSGVYSASKADRYAIAPYFDGSWTPIESATPPSNSVKWTAWKNTSGSAVAGVENGQYGTWSGSAWVPSWNPPNLQNGELESLIASLSVSEVLTILEKDVEDGGYRENDIHGNVTMMANGLYGSIHPQTVNPNLKLCAYEGGQHLRAEWASNTNKETIWQKYLDVNTNERMRGVCEAYLTRWEEQTGGALFNWFSDSYNALASKPYGFWGLYLSNQAYPYGETPKNHGVLNFMATHTHATV